MDHAEAQAFAEQWVKDWNAHDVDALLKHFTEALRKYWSEGVRLIPDLHFEVQAGGVVSEVLTFEGALVREGHGTYLAPTCAR
jgi:hypothetical protein